jgi:tRNA-Thr(GGU) m(6)t(6)A37 methyltransferase TsaA
MTQLTYNPIAIVRSPFRSKFAVPRQPALSASARAQLCFGDNPDYVTALRGLEEFSHLWVIFDFHAHGALKWKPSVRPPRLGGRAKMGVLASRSMHRPNPIGLSVVQLERIDFEALGGPVVHVKGHDLLDGTPVLDVKPYIPYADSVPGASSSWAAEVVPRWKVSLSAEASAVLAAMPEADEFEALLHDVLGIDPRPAFQKRKLAVGDAASVGLRFGFELMDYDVKYEITATGFWVYDLIPLRR